MALARISGGMEFPQGQPIRLNAVPEHLPAHPLLVHLPDRPEVMVGQTVRRGQALLDPPHPSDPRLISPITAVVQSVQPSEQGGYQVVLAPPGQTVVTSLEAPPPRGRKLSQWFHALREVGSWPELDGGVGLIQQLEAAQQRPIHTLVTTGLDAFPPYADQSSLLLSFPDDAVLGTLILGDLVQAKEIVLIAGRVPALLSRLRTCCRKYRLRLTVVHNRYPSAHPTMIARSLGIGTESGAGLPQGHNPVECGMMMVHPWTAIRIGRWFTLRRFDMVRPVFFARPDAAELLTGAFAMAGQALDTVAPELFGPAAGATRVIAGDPMAGHCLHQDHLRVPADQTLLTLLPKAPSTRSEPCINCGWCLDVCPTQLDPVRMYRAAHHRHDDAWLSDQLPWCIECGLCSYVCPSAIPLAQRFRTVHKEMEAPE